MINRVMLVLGYKLIALRVVLSFGRGLEVDTVVKHSDAVP
jgi:hypothetical protein